VIPPDIIITESDLAERYNTSRSPIRYALARAFEAGLVSVRARQGYLVKSIRLDDAQEILHMRLVLEVAAAERASVLIDEMDATNLLRLADFDCVIGGQVNGRKLAASNREFHLAIAKATGNTRLVRAVS